MKFIKESIDFPSSKTSVRECIHPLGEEERRVSRKWGHTWYEDSNYDIVKVKTKDGTVLRRGEPFETESGDKLVINGFDPDTNTVYVVAADDYDPGFDGGADYAVEDIVNIFKHWDEQPIEDTSVGGPKLTTSEGLKEARTKTIEKWGHTWYINEDGDAERQRVEKVKTKNGVTIKLEDILIDEQGNKYHVNSFQIDDDTASVFNEKTSKDGRLDIEEIEEMLEKPEQVEEHPTQEYITTFSRDLLDSLPGFPEDMHWYANRYALDFKTSDSSSYYTVIGAKEDVDRFIRDFDVDVFDESLKEHAEGSKIYRVTYVVDAGANIFSALMIEADSEKEAEKIFKEVYPDAGEIIGIREQNDLEVGRNKGKGMSLVKEDLEEDELEHEEAKEGANPEPPVAGEESAAASLINSLIRDEWLAIEQYNSAMVNLKEYGVDEKIIEVLNHIMFDENTHVGNLQEVLALLAPATNKIEKGNEQAEQILNPEEENTETGDDKE